MIAAFNALPRTADTTEGFFSRWVVVPFSAFFPAGRADPALINRLTRQSELQGLLRNAVGGLQAVMRRGAFTEPESVKKATMHFRTEADPIRGYLADRITSTHPNNSSFIDRTELYADYADWAASNGFAQLSAARFYEQLQMAAVDALEYPVRIARRSDSRGYIGMQLNK